MMVLLLLTGVFGGAFYYLANSTDFVAVMNMYLNLDDDDPEYS
ncbi:U1 [Hyposoter didymator ichnovirus]|nr:U1 [Hyposoter didymator ichnovirus]AIK25670.1 U1 [Hyposoter didymator ichnovirus]